MTANTAQILNFFSTFVRPGDLVFDVGSNIGQKAELFLGIGAKVVCFEPQPHCVQVLRQKYQNNPSVLIVNKGLAPEKGEMELAICSNYDVISTFSQRWQQGRFVNFSFDRTVTVEMTTLDEIIAQVGCPKFCKVDVEGFEYQVLRGLSHPIPYVSLEFTIEYLDDAQKCINHLASLGYTKFNFAVGEKPHLAIAEWVSPEYLFGYIRQASQSEVNLWGDIYAQYEPGNDTIVLADGTRMFHLRPLFQEHEVQPRGVIHIGAHEGQEVDLYQSLGADKLLLIEANPAVFQRLKAKVAGMPNVIAVNCAISDRNGTIDLRVNSFDHSSSILPLKQHKDLFPTLLEVGTVTVPSYTLDSLMAQLNLNPQEFNFINIDIQGAELIALRGATQTLQHIDAICSEINFAELYEGCALVGELDAFLKTCGFDRVATIQPHRPDWGDGFYVKSKNPAQKNLFDLSFSASSVRVNEADKHKSLNTETLTIFTTTKPFSGHAGVIQRNAIQSWTKLNPRPEIILLGDEEGVAEIAREFGLRHVPQVERNEFGTPLISSLFQQARNLATNDVLVYINADIILLNDLMPAVRQVAEKFDRFLMVGQRTNFNIPGLINFGQESWETQLRQLVSQQGQLEQECAIDYFIFSKDLFADIPPFAVGRPTWDNYTIYKAIADGIPVIDATQSVTIVHQNHDYSHLPEGKIAHEKGVETNRNRVLAIDCIGLSQIQTLYAQLGYTSHATWQLTPSGLVQSANAFQVTQYAQRLKASGGELDRQVEQLVQQYHQNSSDIARLEKLQKTQAELNQFILSLPADKILNYRLASVAKAYQSLQAVGIPVLQSLSEGDVANLPERLAPMYLMSGYYSEAISAYIDAIKLKPALAWYYKDLGNALQAQGNEASALRAYKKALELDPTFAEAHANLGNMAYLKGNLDEAIACYQKAIALKPNLAGVYSNLSKILQQQGRVQEADFYQDKFLRLQAGS
jgi:FkbM family methyltransferase